MFFTRVVGSFNKFSLDISFQRMIVKTFVGILEILIWLFVIIDLFFSVAYDKFRFCEVPSMRIIWIREISLCCY